MSRFSDAAFGWMQKERLAVVSSTDLWNGLRTSHPLLTEATPARKTPRATCMRDIRNDVRFSVARGTVSLVQPEE